MPLNLNSMHDNSNIHLVEEEEIRMETRSRTTPTHNESFTAFWLPCTTFHSNNTKLYRTIKNDDSYRGTVVVVQEPINTSTTMTWRCNKKGFFSMKSDY